MNPIRVLLADDTAEWRQLLRLILEQDGRFEIVGEASDGDEAVRQSVAEKPDVVVLDVAMPVLDGFQALPMIRDGSPGSAIVVLSGFARSVLEENMLAAGADAYVEKGDAFSTIIETLLDVTAAQKV